MFDTKWKVLILSGILYQGLLTWSMLRFVDTAAYFSRSGCDDCAGQLFGFILSNQSAYDAATILLFAVGFLILLNTAIWIVSAIKRNRGKVGSGS
ncbi:hypothetical protein AB4037_31165 [Labrys sp. KB_33_2]|uniref:hypothetical protein n=1 Tax=Labrys sp. KB_33_2 TaxID=3237479 RepID=UPI003F9247E3